MEKRVKNKRFILAFSLGLVIISLLYIYRDTLTCAGQSDGSLNADDLALSGRRNLILGFNVGFLQNIDGVAVAMRQIRKDGFVHVRTYYPWTRGLDSDEKIASYMAKIVDNGLVPLLGIAGVPFDMKTAGESAWKGGLNPRQRSVLSRRESLMNLYPPSDLGQYSGRLGALMAALDKSFGKSRVEQWAFEIGNEPNAKMFFWGSENDFRNILVATAEALKNRDPSYHVGCCGFAAGIIAFPDRQGGYLSLLDEMRNDRKVDFISFHVYENVFGGKEDLGRRVKNFVERYSGKNIYVTEWNVDVNRSTAAALINSPAFMGNLINMVKICYDSRIDRLYVHKLMDNPEQNEEQLGLFNSNGTPRQGYGYYRLMNEIVRGGFTAGASQGAIFVKNDNYIALLAEKEVAFKFPGYVVVESSQPFSGTSVSLQPGMWVVVRKGA